MVSLQRGKQVRILAVLMYNWLTGTASTVMVGCVEGILGMRPEFLWSSYRTVHTEGMGWI